MEPFPIGEFLDDVADAFFLRRGLSVLLPLAFLFAVFSRWLPLRSGSPSGQLFGVLQLLGGGVAAILGGFSLVVDLVWHRTGCGAFFGAPCLVVGLYLFVRGNRNAGSSGPRWLGLGRPALAAVGILLLAFTLVLGDLYPDMRDEAFGERCTVQLGRIETAKRKAVYRNELVEGEPAPEEVVARRCWEGLLPRCPSGGQYTLNTLETTATCPLADPQAKGEKAHWHRLVRAEERRSEE